MAYGAPGGGFQTAAQVPFDNSGSGLTSTTVQGALDELAAASGGTVGGPTLVGAAATVTVDAYAIASQGRGFHYLMTFRDTTTGDVESALLHGEHDDTLVQYGSPSVQGAGFLYTVAMSIAAGVLSVDITNNHANTLSVTFLRVTA